MSKLGLILIVLLSACASQVPMAIKKAPENNLSLAVVRAGVGDFKGQAVRWGGEITKVENQSAYTLVELLGRELNSYGKPIQDGDSGGRFIARFTGFADPALYSVGRLLTVAGTIDGEISSNIGEYSYSFPVVSVTSSYLWPMDDSKYDNWPAPWYYDPWYYDPWYYSHHPSPFRYR